jgi:hypothetical protein
MAFHSDAHLMLAHEPTPPEVAAWQHPQIPDSYTVTIDTTDRSGHIAISGNPTQLIDLLGRMTDAVIEVATPHPTSPRPPRPRPSRPARAANHPARPHLADQGAGRVLAWQASTRPAHQEGKPLMQHESNHSFISPDGRQPAGRRPRTHLAGDPATPSRRAPMRCWWSHPGRVQAAQPRPPPLAGQRHGIVTARVAS